MKPYFSFVLLFIALTFSSCSEYYFSSPQPVDAENVYKIPKKYTGSWLLEEDRRESSMDIDSLVIGKTYYHRIKKFLHKESKMTLESDSNVYLINNKMYSNEDGILQGGYDYRVVGDSIFIDVQEFELTEFGENTFLRKFGYGYLLNERHTSLHDWWSVKFIDTRNKEGILIREMSKQDMDKAKDFSILHEDYDEYIIAEWTKEDFLNFIDLGGFSDTTLVLNYDEKIKN